MTKDHKVKDEDAGERSASRYRDELEPPPTAPGQPQQTQGVAPSSSKIGEAVERPQYGNVIRRSLERDEGEGDDVRPGSGDVLEP